MYEDRDSMASGMNGSTGGNHSSEMSSTRLLSSLVGGTSSLLDGAKFSSTTTTTAKSHNEDDLRVIDMSKQKQELDTEFDQVFKKMNRVKDNYSTHKKFMDIVKSKSMKALNRKSSITSLPQQNSIGGDSYDTRGSMPPDQNGSVTSGGSVVTSSSGNKPISSRAKSMSKEPGESGQTMPSRFFSLSRRLGAKIRFSSSSQPHTKQSAAGNLSAKSATNLTEDPTTSSSLLKKSSGKTQSQMLVPSISVENVAQQQQQQQALKNAESGTIPAAVSSSSTSSATTFDEKKNLRERALSPSRIFRSLRPRSPFGRSTRSKVVLN